jgi:hypothetical protein
MRLLGLVLTLLWLGAGVADAKCRVLNTTGIDVRAGSTALGAYELRDVTDAVFDVTAKSDALVKKAKCAGLLALRERTGVFTLEVLPAWLDISFGSNLVRVTAPAGAKITIGDKEQTIVKTPIEQTLDPRASLLAADLRGVSLDSLRFAPVPLRIVHARKTIELVLGVDVSVTLKSLFGEIKDIGEKPLAWATVVGGTAPHPALWMSCETSGCALQGSVGISTLANAQLVAVGQTWTKSIETCKSGIERVQPMQDISVFEATTGKELAKLTFAGQLPDACPAQSASKTITGAFDRMLVLEWLKTL